MDTCKDYLRGKHPPRDKIRQFAFGPMHACLTCRSFVRHQILWPFIGMLVVINNPILLVSIARHLDLHESMSTRSSVIQDSGECMGVA